MPVAALWRSTCKTSARGCMRHWVMWWICNLGRSGEDGLHAFEVRSRLIIADQIWSQGREPPLKKSIPAWNVWKKIFQNFSVCCSKANGHWPFHLRFDPSHKHWTALGRLTDTLFCLLVKGCVCVSLWSSIQKQFNRKWCKVQQGKIPKLYLFLLSLPQVTVQLENSDCHTLSPQAQQSQELCLCTDDSGAAAFNMTFSELGQCPIAVKASTGGKFPCQRDGEGTANVVAVDRVTRKLKVEVQHYMLCNGKYTRVRFSAKWIAMKGVGIATNDASGFGVRSYPITEWPWKSVQLDGHIDWLHFDSSASLTIGDACSCIT